ncbi:MAG TPA: sigma-70 family RNA polymerase sigma factor [Chloroflexota bacterium]|nr:sigma-70 family RNA polymerase sigma factor [Chloroflexota bacterium]
MTTTKRSTHYPRVEPGRALRSPAPVPALMEIADTRAHTDPQQTVGVDSVAVYLAEIGTIPLLTARQEKALALTLATGQSARHRLESESLTPRERDAALRDVARADDARRRLIEANLRLVVHIASRYRLRELAFSDLIQEGNLGLSHAVDKFDYRLGCRLSTYASWWIRQAISRALANESRTVRLPVYKRTLARQAARMRDELAQQTGQEPSPADIASALHLPLAIVNAALSCQQPPISLDAPITEDGATLAEVLPDVDARAPEEEAEAALLSWRVHEVLATLPERERTVLQLRFGLQGHRVHTLGEIGERMGLTRERVRQIETKALVALRSSDLSSECDHPGAA